MFLFLYIALSLPLWAVEKKVYWDKAPFVPCGLCDIPVKNASSLSLQMSVVDKGESVKVIAWVENNRDVVVELLDGSRGYMPVICFMNGGVDIPVGEKKYVFSFHEDQVTHDSRSKRYLPKGVFRFEAAYLRDATRFGMNPVFLVATSPGAAKKYYVENSLENPSYSEWEVKSLSSADLQELDYDGDSCAK